MHTRHDRLCRLCSFAGPGTQTRAAAYIDSLSRRLVLFCFFFLLITRQQQQEEEEEEEEGISASSFDGAGLVALHETERAGVILNFLIYARAYYNSSRRLLRDVVCVLASCVLLLSLRRVVLFPYTAAGAVAAEAE